MSDELQKSFTEDHGHLKANPAIQGMLFSDVNMLSLIALKPIRLNIIAKQTGYTAQSVGRHCGRMAKNGLITVKKDKRDKRAKLASITKKGANIKVLCDEFLESTKCSK